MFLSDVKHIVADPQIHINRFKDAILELTNKKIEIQPYLTINFDSTDPLNGIFTYISNRDHEKFHTNVVVEASSTYQAKPMSIIEKSKTANFFSTKTMADQWIKFTFSIDEVQLTGYVIQTHNLKLRPYIKNWTFSGSKDGINWVILDSVVESNALSQPNSHIMRKVDTKEFYRAFKLDHTGTNSLGYDNIILSHVELFGAIRDYDPDQQ